MERLTSFKRPCDAQNDCVLFNKIPAEIRDRIYGFALCYYDDPDRLYPCDNPYWRPDCIAPPKVDCALLQTCQIIYIEAWFRPWSSLVHKLWLTAPDRAPGRRDTLNTSTLSSMLKTIFQYHGKVETRELQIFPQMYKLEGGRLMEVLRLEHLHPLNITITIRHTDWYYWELDERLRMDPKWIPACRFPDSLKTINLELESLVRKTKQIDYIADRMADTWHFQTQNGTIFTADKESMKVSQWTSGSTWNNERWVRDETLAKPELVDFYIKKVIFVPDRSLSELPKRMPKLQVPEDFKVIEDERPALRCGLMADAGIPAGADANQARRLVSEYIERTRADGDNIDSDNDDSDFPHDDFGDHDWDDGYDDNDDGDSDHEFDADGEHEL